MIVLIGFMGAGKTTAGRLTAQRLEIPFFDSDEEVERIAGRRVSDIFETEGESGFRARESEAIRSLLSRGEGVVALGGGAPLIPEVRTRLQQETVVYLKAPLESLRARLPDDGTRPMLDGDVATLFDGREPVYERIADVVVDATMEPEIVAAEIISGVEGRMKVALDERSYAVVVAPGVRRDTAREISRLISPEQAFVVTHPSLAGIAGEVVALLTSVGIKVSVREVPEGESSKTLEVAAELLDAMAAAKLHRGDVVVGVGGGVVTDMAGFVASVYARGIPVVHVPTTLLAQVDAAIGGKTGVDLSRAKNLVGTFHQPRLVLCDPELLDTLPAEEFVAGLAEVVKAALIADPGLLSQLEQDSTKVLNRDPETLLRAIRKAVSIKASVVSGDETESGRRAILNYGHTFAHAIEVVEGFGGIRHGEAVSLGMMAAAHLAEVLEIAPQGLSDLHREILGSFGLPVEASYKVSDLSPVWELDKKYSRGVRFVLLREVGDPITGVEVGAEALGEALERMVR